MFRVDGLPEPDLQCGGDLGRSRCGGGEVGRKEPVVLLMEELDDEWFNDFDWQDVWSVRQLLLWL